MDDSMIEATQALEFSDYGETDDEQENDKPVGYLNVPCQKGFAGKLFPVQQGENIIGRGENCSICIPLKGLSREHACIEVKGDAHFIYDKGSRNRTKRNKHFLAASVRYELKDKDELTFGDVDCKYQVGEQLEADGDEIGSETGSECMFQTADETGNITGNTKSKLLGDLEDDDDGAESDASSDILQPTQPFANASSTQSMIGKNRTQNGDSTHMTVMETPVPSKSKRFTDNLTLPESDADTTDDEGADPCGLSTMVVADSQDVSNTEKSLLIGAATQAYVCDSDITTDEEKTPSPKKRSILMQATQRYTESDASTCSEESPEKSARKRSLLTAATQAYCTDEEESPPKKTKAKNIAEPTVPYTMVAGIEPTQAYDMEEEDEEEAEGKSSSVLYEPTQAYNMGGEDDEEEEEEEEEKADEKKSTTLLQQATQAYTEDLNKHTDKEEDDAESDTSEEFVLDGDTENEDNDEEEAERIMAAPTLAMDVEEPGLTEAETVVADDATQVFDEKDKNKEDETQVFTDDATQVIEEDKGASRKPAASDQAETQVFTEDATQVFEDVGSSKKKQKVVTAAIDETQVVTEDATQVFEEERKTCEDKHKKQVVSEEATQVFDDVDEKVQSSDNQNDDTQAFDDQGIAETKTKSGGSEEATQVFDTETHVEAPRQQVVGDKKVGEGEATQVFDEGEEEEEFDINAMSTLAAEEETMDDEDTEGDADEEVEKTGNEDATQVFDDDTGTVNVEELGAKTPAASKTKGKKEITEDDATQVFEDQTAPVGEADETVAVQEDISPKETVKPTRGGRGKASRKTVKEKETLDISEIATQAIEDSTVKISEPDATVIVTEDATVAISESDNETKELSARKGRGRSTRSIIDAKLKAAEKTEAATLMVEDATLAVSDIEYEKNSRNSETTKRQRKGKTNKKTDNKITIASEAETVAVADTVAVEEEVSEESVSRTSETAKKQSRRKGKTNKKIEDNEITVASEGETVPVADTVAVEEEVIEETTKPKRKGRKSAAQKVEDVPKPNNEKTESVKKVTQKEPELVKETEPQQRRRGRASTAAAEEVKVPEENTRKSGRGSRKKTNKEKDLTGIQGKTTAAKQDVKEKDQDIEPATQIYSDDMKGAEDHASNEAATQRYGDDSDTPGTPGKEEATQIYEEEDSTPDISELGLVDDDSEEESLLIPKPPLVPIPSRSPLKSALASPDKKREKSPSPKRVKFISQNSDTSSEGEVRPKRGKRQLQGKESQEETKVKSKVGQRKGTRGKARGDKSEEATFEKETPADTVSADTVEESSAPTRGGRRKSAAGKKVAVSDETPEVETAKPSRGKKGRKLGGEETTADSEETGELKATKASRGKKPVVGETAADSEKVVEIETTKVSRCRNSRTSAAVDTPDVSDGKDEAKPGRQSRGRNKPSAAVEQTDVPEETKEVETARASRGRTNKKQADVVQETVVKDSRTSNKNENIPQNSELSNSKRSARGKDSKKLENVKSEEESNIKKNSKKDVKVEIEKSGSESKAGRTATRSKVKNVKTDKSGPSTDEPKDTVTSEEISVGNRRTRGKTKDADTVSNASGDGKTDTSAKVEQSEEDKSSEKVSVESKRTSAKGKAADKKGTKNTTQKCDTSEVVPKRSSRTRGGGDEQDDKQSGLEQTASDSNDSVKPGPQTSRQSSRGAKNMETKEKVVKVEKEEVQKPNKKGKIDKTDSTKDNNANLDTSKVKEEMPKPSRTTRGKRKETPDPEEDDQSVETPAKKQKTKSTQGTVAQSPAAAGRKGPGTETPKSNSKRVSSVSTPTTKSNKDLDSSVVNSPTLRKSTVSTSKPKVMFTGVVDEQGEKTVKDLGGEMVSSVYDCTHLVTDQIRRTVKFLCCLSRGVPIVTPQWLVSTRGSGFFSDPSPFIVRDDASEKKFKFTLLSSLDKASEKQLLAGYKIHITKSVKPEPAQMKDIVQCAGAQYLGSMPKAASEGTVVISCADDKVTCQGAISAGIPVVSAEFVLTGVLRQEVDINAYLLFSTSNGNKRQATGPATEPSAAKKRKR